MAALRVRVALSKVKPWDWGFQPKGGMLGLLGMVIRSSTSTSFNIIDQNSSHSRAISQQCRHYFIPPPPHQKVVDLYFSAYSSVVDNEVISSAEYAVKFHNELQGGDVRFVRIIRANVYCDDCIVYYITLEAFDNKASELNVYYAEVLTHSSKNLELMRWQLVDESFSYPFIEIRSSELVEKENRRSHEAFKNNIMEAWIHAMGKQSDDDMAYIGECKRNPADPFRSILKFEMKHLVNIDISPPKSALYALPTAASDSVVPVYDIITYRKVYDYALFAVSSHNKNEGDEIQLEEVLWARKSKAGDGVVYYFLLLEAMDENKEINFYYAIVRVRRTPGYQIMYREKLIEWHQIEESSFPRSSRVAGVIARRQTK